MTPIFAASGTTILGVKLNRPLTTIAKKKFLQHCHNEAAIILSSILIGYLQWCENKGSHVTIFPPLENNSYSDLKEHRSQQQVIRQLIERLKLFQPVNSPHPRHSSLVLNDKHIKLPKHIHHHPEAFMGFLFDQKTKDIDDYIGEQPCMVTNELDPLAPKRWRPLFMHNHNAPWGWPLDNDKLNQPPPNGFGPFLPLTSAKQQVFGMVHGSCLCMHLKETQPHNTSLGIYEWPTMAQSAHSPSWCLGCALYLSALGYMCPNINLSSTPSWIAPRDSLIPLTKGAHPKLLDSSINNLSPAYERFKTHMHDWMVAGLQTLNKKQHRKRLNSVSRTARGKMIIPLMLKKLQTNRQTNIGNRLDTPQLYPQPYPQHSAALLFEDALTLSVDTITLLHQVIGKLKI